MNTNMSTNVNMRMRKVQYASRCLLFLSVVGAAGQHANGQQITDKAPPAFIKVSGEARINVSPDQAEISIGVVAKARTAQEASDQGAQRQEAVISHLRHTLGANADIKTLTYSLNPSYVYENEGSQPTITGYTSSNTVLVRLTNIMQIGKVIDIATESDSHSFQYLRYIVKNEEAVRMQALREASTNARIKAESIATALGLRILRISQVEEPLPKSEVGFTSGFVEARGSASTPAELGTIDIRASVTLTVEVAP